MARGFLAMSCFWQGGTERSRPFPTKQPNVRNIPIQFFNSQEAGICNYSIFYCNDELFGYYECEKGVAYAEKVQSESPVVDRWNEYMKDILELEMDPVTGAQPKLEQVFRLD